MAQVSKASSHASLVNRVPSPWDPHKSERKDLTKKLSSAFSICAMGREMSHWLRELAALVEDPGLVSSTQMVTHNHLQLQLQGIQCPLLASGTHMMHTYMQTKHTCT